MNEKKYSGLRVTEYGPTVTSSAFLCPLMYSEHHSRPMVATPTSARPVKNSRSATIEPSSLLAVTSSAPKNAAAKSRDTRMRWLATKSASEKDAGGARESFSTLPYSRRRARRAIAASGRCGDAEHVAQVAQELFFLVWLVELEVDP